MKLNLSREWMEWAADTEEGFEVGAGVLALQSPSYRSSLKIEQGSNDAFCQQVERDRERFYIRLLIGAWGGKRISRAALDAGLVLMLNDELREAQLGNAPLRRLLKPTRIVNSLDYVLQEMASGGRILIDASGAQQFLTLADSLPEAIPADDQQRLSETKLVFDRQRQLGNVDETEELLDAQFELVSA